MSSVKRTKGNHLTEDVKHNLALCIMDILPITAHEWTLVRTKLNNKCPLDMYKKTYQKLLGLKEQFLSKNATPYAVELA